MLMTLTTTHRPATDLGFLLHKHPDRFQSFELSFGRAHVFYPEAAEERCTACLLLDIDPVGLVRRKGMEAHAPLAQYVNDRPYTVSSFLSVAIAQVFGSALKGRCQSHTELVATPIPLEARLEVLPVKGGERFVRALFEPLNYSVEARRHPLDDQFPDWGESPYYSVTIAGVTTLSALLTHLYVFIPVFDLKKHYFVGEDELEKLLSKGEGWLAGHPEREEIARRYLRFRPHLYRPALARLMQDDPNVNSEETESVADPDEEVLERPLSLYEQRLGAVLAAIRSAGAKRVLDLGCGDGQLLKNLLKDSNIEEIVGMDVSARALETARDRLKLDRLPERQAARIKLIHGSLIYRDRRIEGFDAAAVVEVIEHFDPSRLTAFERAIFDCARPRTVVLTTPNREYNIKWENVGPERLRHPDHRFEWTRTEFQNWAKAVADRYGYNVQFLPVGPEDEAVGAPTQMGVFQRGHGIEG